MNEHDHHFTHGDNEGDDLELELIDLEAELGALRPVAVAPELLAKVETSLLQTGSTTIRSATVSSDEGNIIQVFFTRYGQVAAAALLTVCAGALYLMTQTPASDPSANSSEIAATTPSVSGPSTSHQSAVPSSPNKPSPQVVPVSDMRSGYERVRSDSRVIDPSDGGVIIDENGQPYRLLQYDYHEEQEWRNPRDKTDVKVNRPSTEKIMIPLEVM